jgi:hypothetical protein
MLINVVESELVGWVPGPSPEDNDLDGAMDLDDQDSEWWKSGQWQCDTILQETETNSIGLYWERKDHMHMPMTYFKATPFINNWTDYIFATKFK